MHLKEQPLAEVFGFPINNLTQDAKRYRTKKLCPFNNKVPNCTKDKANDPLGVCSVFEEDFTAITCPIRFRENWIIADDAADFFFPEGTRWTSLTEVRMKDKQKKSAGNIDMVLVSYDKDGQVLDFGALEIQGVYISGNVRNPFEHYMKDPERSSNMNWRGQKNYPGPDYLSSSRKRLAPQLIFKSGILNHWNKKTAVVLDQGFFNALPQFTEVDKKEGEIAWLVYDLVLDAAVNRYVLTRRKAVYTRFSESLDKITRSEPGEMQDFVSVLQGKLDEKLGGSTEPINQTIDEVL